MLMIFFDKVHPKPALCFLAMASRLSHDVEAVPVR
jgi:hypothetical protein